MTGTQRPLDDNSRDSSDYVANVVARFAGGQSIYRTIGSGWLLAGLGAISFLLIETEPCSRQFLFSPGFVVVAVSGLTAFGLALLWYQDQYVYQRMLNSAFAYGLFLEFKDPRLPQVRTALYAHIYNISRRLSLYYVLPILFLFLIAFFVAQTGSLDVTCVLPAVAQQPTEEVAKIAPADRAALDALEHRGTTLLLLFHGLMGLAIVIFIVRSKHSIAETFATDYPPEFQAYLQSDAFRERLRSLDVDTSPRTPAA